MSECALQRYDYIKDDKHVERLLIQLTFETLTQENVPKLKKCNSEIF